MADEFDLPEQCRYTEDDEWVRRDGERLAIGISDYAQQQLGDIVFVELPSAGDAISAGEPFGVVESVKAVGDLVAPVSGEVIEVNGSLEEKPEVVNEDCYGEGWMIVVRPSDPGAFDALMDVEAYRRSIADRKT